MNSALQIIIGILLILAGLGAMLSSVAHGLAYIFAAAFIIPRSREYIEKKIEMKVGKVTVAVVILFALMLPVIAPGEPSYQKEQRVKNETAQEEFEKDKTAIFNSIDAAMNEKDYEKAALIAEKYTSTNDLALMEKYGAARKARDEIKNAENSKVALEELKTVPESDLEKRLEIYNRLISYDSENKEYQDKLNSYSQKLEARKEADIKKALSSLKKNVDEMEGITWYSDKTSPKHNNANAFYLYFGKSNTDGKYPLRLKIQYYSDDWLFINSFFVVADGQRFERNHVTFDRDNYAEIWEWTDQPMTPDDKSMIEAIINSKKATIRFQGTQYHADRTISAQQKTALKNVLTAYEKID